MDRTFLIRTAHPDEAAVLADIEAACFPPAEAASPEQLRKRMETFPNWFLVAEAPDRKVIGMINGMTVDQDRITDELYERAELHDEQGSIQTVFGLDVLPEWRKQGVAGELMRAFVELSAANNRKKVVLTCKQHLIGMYEHMGFKNLGVSGSVHGGAIWYDMEIVL